MSDGRVILWLDDCPNRSANCCQKMKPEDAARTIWAQTSAEAIEVLANYRARLEIVSLDHDLAGPQPQDIRSDTSGMEVVRWLEKQDASTWQHVKFVIHSWNPSAGSRMNMRLQAAGYHCHWQPYGS